MTVETVLYSVKEEGHERGVALMLDEFAEKCLLDKELVCDRIIRARFDSRYAKMTVVQCYAPTNATEEEVKERFYEQLQGIVDKIFEHEVVIVGGDLNAKVGIDNKRRERCIWKFKMGEMNENGHLFSDFCMENGLFQHREIHKYT
jgi:exonuclease III